MDKGCQDKVAWELHAKMPKLAQAGVKNQIREMQVMGCHGCQVNAEVLHVKDRLGQDRMQACAWDRTLASNTPKSKTARCAEADGRFGTNAVVASKTSSR